MEKEIEATREITSQEIDALRKARLNSMEENSRLREIISKKDNEIADLSNPPPPPMNDSSQKLLGWLSDDLRPLPSSMSVVLKIKLWNSIKVLPENIYWRLCKSYYPRMRWFREARQIPYPINPFIVDQHNPKSLFRVRVAQKRYHRPKQCPWHQLFLSLQVPQYRRW
jgi:hypothetical protein